jgi:hypothetical protein
MRHKAIAKGRCTNRSGINRVVVVIEGGWMKSRSSSRNNVEDFFVVESIDRSKINRNLLTESRFSRISSRRC